MKHDPKMVHDPKYLKDLTVDHARLVSGAIYRIANNEPDREIAVHILYTVLREDGRKVVVVAKAI